MSGIRPKSSRFRFPVRFHSWTWTLSSVALVALLVVVFFFNTGDATITLTLLATELEFPSRFYDSSQVIAADEASAYLDLIERRIMAVWKVPPHSDGLKVTLRYGLARSGSVSLVRVEKGSGNSAFDNSAVQALRSASPFPPPPKSFPIGDLRMVLEPIFALPGMEI